MNTVFVILDVGIFSQNNVCSNNKCTVCHMLEWYVICDICI